MRYRVEIDVTRYWHNRTVWYLNGRKNRQDGPAATISNGNKYYYLNDHYHREDGPALIILTKTDFYDVGEKYYLFNRLYSKQDFYNIP